MMLLEQDMSMVVYDEQDRPGAVVFCSTHDNALHVDLLLGFGADTQKKILMVLQGMGLALKSNHALEDYDSLTAIAANDNVLTLMKKMLDPGNAPEKAGQTIYMSKRIRERWDEKITLEATPDTDSEDAWRREIRKSPLQGNISYKLPWYRRVGKLESGDDITPVRYEKDEDEKGGLLSADALRITTNNCKRFRSYLPTDVVHGMAHPFYRGLVIQKDTDEEPAALMVWIYENLLEEEQTQARILFFCSKDANAAKSILAEYSNEIAREGTKVSRFWLTDLSKEAQSYFADAGFYIEEKDSPELLLSVEDFKKAALLRNKNYHFVKDLQDITEKQYARGIARLAIAGNGGMPEDLAYLSKEWFDTQISSCFVNDGNVLGMLLVHSLDEKTCFVDMVQSAGGDPEIEMLYLMRYSLRKFLKKNGADSKVVIRPVHTGTGSIVGRLFPEKKGKKVFFGERKEA